MELDIEYSIKPVGGNKIALILKQISLRQPADRNDTTATDKGGIRGGRCAPAPYAQYRLSRVTSTGNFAKQIWREKSVLIQPLTTSPITAAGAILQ